MRSARRFCDHRAGAAVANAMKSQGVPVGRCRADGVPGEALALADDVVFVALARLQAAETRDETPACLRTDQLPGLSRLLRKMGTVPLLRKQACGCMPAGISLTSQARGGCTCQAKANPSVLTC